MIKTVNIQHIEELPLLKDKQLLAVGKGPSSSRWKPEYLNAFNVVGSNHAAAVFNTPISHFTDYEMFQDQTKHSQFVICSAFMNYQCRTVKDLTSLVQEDREMGRLYKEKRLFSYDIITPDGFSTNLFQKNQLLFKYAFGVLIIQVAQSLKMKQLFTLGIDGGTQYHSDFEATKGNGMFLDEQLDLMKKLSEGVEIIAL